MRSYTLLLYCIFVVWEKSHTCLLASDGEAMIDKVMYPPKPNMWTHQFVIRNRKGTDEATSLPTPCQNSGGSWKLKLTFFKTCRPFNRWKDLYVALWMIRVSSPSRCYGFCNCAEGSSWISQVSAFQEVKVCLPSKFHELSLTLLHEKKFHFRGNCFTIFYTGFLCLHLHIKNITST